jgi:hypothetical protein
MERSHEKGLRRGKLSQKENRRMYLCRSIFLAIFGAGLGCPTPIIAPFQNQIVPGMHPNYDIQLPLDLSNNTGISFADLLKQDPQYDFAFSNNLILYFNPINPAKQVIVTTPRVPEEPDLGGLFFFEGVPPDCHITGTCVVTPPDVFTPELPTGLMGTLLPILLWAGRRRLPGFVRGWPDSFLQHAADFSSGTRDR